MPIQQFNFMQGGQHSYSDHPSVRSALDALNTVPGYAGLDYKSIGSGGRVLTPAPQPPPEARA